MVAASAVRARTPAVLDLVWQTLCSDVFPASSKPVLFGFIISTVVVITDVEARDPGSRTDHTQAVVVSCDSGVDFFVTK